MREPCTQSPTAHTVPSSQHLARGRPPPLASLESRTDDDNLTSATLSRITHYSLTLHSWTQACLMPYARLVGTFHELRMRGFEVS